MFFCSLLRKYIGVKADDTVKQNEVIFDFHFFNLACVLRGLRGRQLSMFPGRACPLTSL